MPPDLSVLVDLALLGEHGALRQICLAAVDDGAPLPDVVTVLSDVQVEVGRRWLTARATVAEEHRATAGVDTVLAALELRIPGPADGPPVICVCAEGEWHSLGSRMVALVLAAAGWPTAFLGPSLPAADLAHFVRERSPAAVAITCATVAALPGAARCVEAVRATGAPVMVGGHAFSVVPTAAAALGVPYAPDLDEAASAIGLSLPYGAAAELDHDGVAALDLASAQLLDHAGARLGERRGVRLSAETSVREAVEYALGFGRAAVLLGTSAVLTDQLVWLDAFLTARAAPVSGSEILAAVAQAASDLLAEHKDLRRCLSP